MTSESSSCLVCPDHDNLLIRLYFARNSLILILKNVVILYQGLSAIVLRRCLVFFHVTLDYYKNCVNIKKNRKLLSSEFLSDTMLHNLIRPNLILRAWNISKPHFFVPSRIITCGDPTPTPKIVLKSSKVPKIQKQYEDHDLRNMKIGRPMAPHLTVYRNELHSLLSIIHRSTGVFATLYLMALGNQALLLSCQIDYYLCSLEELHLGAIVIAGMKFIVGFPFFYHYANGIRHLIWDTGAFLEMKEVYATAYVMIGLTMVLTCAFAFL